VTSVGPADLPNSPRENQPYAYTGRGMSFIIKKRGFIMCIIPEHGSRISSMEELTGALL
jgi:hypothetical protein